MILVKATREGLLGRRTATGVTIDGSIPFVALPSEKAKYRFVRIHNGQASVLAIVLDVGPWNTHDDAYVFDGARPQSETGTDTHGRRTNRAGIDLSDAVWKALGMTDNGMVAWEFAA